MPNRGVRKLQFSEHLPNKTEFLQGFSLKKLAKTWRKHRFPNRSNNKRGFYEKIY